GGDPLMLHDGAYFYQAVDLEIPGRGIDWKLERTYRSDVTTTTSLGHNWELNYSRHLVEVTANNLDEVHCTFPDAEIGDVVSDDGYSREDLYEENPDGSFTSPAGYYSELTHNGDGS